MTSPFDVVSHICAKMVAMHRMAKLVLMVAADLLALPCCFLIATRLRPGDFSQAGQYGAAPYLLAAVPSVAGLSAAGLYRAVIRFLDKRMLMVSGIALAGASLCLFALLLAILHGKFSCRHARDLLVRRAVVRARLARRRTHLLRSPARLNLAGRFSQPTDEAAVKALPGWARANERGFVERAGVHNAAVMKRSMAGGIRRNDAFVHLMVSQIISKMIERGGLDYLMYNTYFGASPGLKVFKSDLGFQPFLAKYSIQ